MDDNAGHGSAFMFGPFTVLPKGRLLLRSGRPVRVGSRAFDLLRVLCERAGEVVSKETLMDAVWGGVVVDEGNLRVHMAALRKALDDGHAGNRYIANIPLRGYSLVAPVGAGVRHADPAVGADSARSTPGQALEGAAVGGSTALVHVIDDDEAMREALDSLFRSMGMATRVYALPAEFLDSPRPECPSCLVLDIRLPGMSGLDFQRRLSELAVPMPVVFMTGFGDIPMCARAMKAGAVDFLTKPFRDQDMLDAVTRAIDIDRVRRVEQHDGDGLKQCYARLSPRERQVMALVVEGKMNKQVAAALGLSEITVKIHRGHAMKKMGARSLAEFVRMAGALRLGEQPAHTSV